MQIPEFPVPVLESLCSVIADTTTGLTGSKIGRYLRECDFPDPAPDVTKRVRLYEAFRQKQSQDRCANNIVAFIQTALSPVRHTMAPDYYEQKRSEVNQILVFVGFELTEAGIVRQVPRADNLREAAGRADHLRRILRDRDVHPDVLRFCRQELLVENYFHAVLEATKSVAEKIRERTLLTSDGSDLVDQAFAFRAQIPHLALSSLTTDSEQSEQSGFMNLLKGLFGMFRNPTAHTPKIAWPMKEQDALDILSVVSLAHRKIDKAVDAYKISTRGLP